MRYKSVNLRKLIRYAAFDLALILAAVILTHFGRQHFMAANRMDTGGICLPVLLYHSVTDLPETDFCITPETLEEDLKYLQENGYHTISPEDLIGYTAGDASLPPNPVMLTFDDGLYNNLSIVLPLLEQYDMCATISVVGIYADVFAPDSPHQETYSYLTWDDLRTLSASDRITLASHTYDLHKSDIRQGCRIMDGESEENYHRFLFEDLMQLQTRFSEELELQPVVFAYPYGFVCDESIPVLREAGFQVTLTSLEQPNYITRDPACLYGLGRYNRSGNISTEMYMANALSSAEK